VPSTLPTAGIDYGLLPTATTQETTHPAAKLTETGRRKGAKGTSHSLNLADMAALKLMPTPTATLGEEKNGNFLHNKNNDDTCKAYRQILQPLLPTPTVMDSNTGDQKKVDARRAKLKAKKINGNGFGQSLGELAQKNLLPTPTVGEALAKPMIVEEKRKMRNGQSYNSTLTDLAASQLLPTLQAAEGHKLTGLENQPSMTKMVRQMQNLAPTPAARDYNGKSGQSRNQKRANPQDSVPNMISRMQEKLIPTPAAQNHKGAKKINKNMQGSPNLPDYIAQTLPDGQLNPLFVLEMMGFPPDWTLLPFLMEENHEALTTPGTSGEAKA
jgi:hypothetical protein